MIDPLAEVVGLLQPGAPFSKMVHGAGSWRVRRKDVEQPFYGVILEGSCNLAIDGHEPISLQEGDFILTPAACATTTTSREPPPPEAFDVPPVPLRPGEFRVGIQSGPPDVRFLVGHCVFGSPDAALLVSLLPQVVHVRGQKRLATLVQLVGEEARELRPARDVILARLLEVLLIEALRSTTSMAAPPGLAPGKAPGAPAWVWPPAAPAWVSPPGAPDWVIPSMLSRPPINLPKKPLIVSSCEECPRLANCCGSGETLVRQAVLQRRRSALTGGRERLYGSLTGGRARQKGVGGRG